MRGNKEVQSRHKFTKREVKALMTRHLLGLAVDLRKSELDVLVTLKVDVFLLYSQKIVLIKLNNIGLCHCAPDGGQNLSSGN